MKIHDCSNSSERPANRGYGGAVENAVVTMLKRYAPAFDSEFVDDPHHADLIFTNDVYPSNIVHLDIPRVKRMDGVFWQHGLKHRNVALNSAALISDHVTHIVADCGIKRY